jgi:hypothetical protein
MFLSDLRGQKLLGGFLAEPGSAGRAGRAPHAAPDARLILDCHSLADLKTSLFSGIERLAAAECRVPADSHAKHLASLQEIERRFLSVAQRIADTPALTERGVWNKAAVIKLLLSLRHDDPSPKRDAILLSYLLDVERLSRTKATMEGGNAGREITQTEREIVVASETCVALIEQLSAGFARLEKDALLCPKVQDQITAAQCCLIEEMRCNVSAIADMRAPSFCAAQSKARVLRRLLEIGDTDADRLRVDLARSYIADISWLTSKAQGGGGLASSAAPWWSSLWSKFHRHPRNSLTDH